MPFTAQDGDTMLKVGSRDDFATLMKGEIAEVLMYDAALSPSELDNVRQYLGYKYNLAVLLSTNIAPTVAVTNLTENQNFTTPTNIVLAASASDADGGILQVQFYANGTPLPADSTAPYTADLAIEAAGQIEIKAVVTDNLGLTSTSSVVHITATGSEPLPIPASGLVLWLRGDKGVTETNGAVTGWQDFSGNFNHASQPNLTKAPALTQNGSNGKPVLHFDGGDDSMDVAGSSSLALTGDMTTFFVVNIADFATYRVVWAKTAGNLARPYDYYTLPTTGIPRAFRGGASGHSSVDAMEAPIPGEFSVMGWEVNGGTNLTHYLNGAENGSGPVTVPATDDGNPLRIGTRGDDFTRLKGDLAEIIIYNRALDQTERTQVVSYLNSKYALGGTEPQPPSITVSRGSNNTLIFAWPSTEAQFVLQANDGLASDGWTDVTEAVVPSGDQNTVTVAITGSARFFRLVSNPNQP
jgi:hypothetical protein